MKIGLIKIEPKIVNTAYMQISQYHKGRGDVVEWWSPLMHSSYDKVYCSSIFDFTDKSEVPDGAVCGGTGFDVSSRLPKEIEKAGYDYSLYPKCRTSYLWFSRGCVRRCPWCVVPEKEGKIRPVEPKNLNPRGEYITVCDNNFFANQQWPAAIQKLKQIGQAVDIQQGVDVRLLDGEKCHILNKLKKKKRIKIAWDDPHFNMQPNLKYILRFIPAWKLMCFVLIGYNSSELQDMFRVNTLRQLGIDPFIMPYNKSDLYQRSFARWVNCKEIYKKVTWGEYKYRVEAREAAVKGWKT